MNNTIKGLTGAGAPPAKPVAGQSGGASAEPSSRRPGASDQVTLTDAARRMQAAERRAAESSGVDEQRVERIREALSDGSYRIDPQRVASGLLAFERALFGGK